MARVGFTQESMAACFLLPRTFHHLPMLFYVLGTFPNNYALNNPNTNFKFVPLQNSVLSAHLQQITVNFGLTVTQEVAIVVSLYCEEIDLVTSTFTKLYEQEDAQLEFEPTFSLKEYVYIHTVVLPFFVVFFKLLILNMDFLFILLQPLKLVIASFLVSN